MDRLDSVYLKNCGSCSLGDGKGVKLSLGDGPKDSVEVAKEYDASADDTPEDEETEEQEQEQAEAVPVSPSGANVLAELLELKEMGLLTDGAMQTQFDAMAMQPPHRTNGSIWPQ